MDAGALRARMVDEQIAARGVRDRHVLEAMRTVPREEFVPEHLRAFAYDDRALPIQAGQTISQPYIVALMIEAAGVAPGNRVLEVGAGSGYAAAVLALIAGEVIAIERHGELASLAAERLKRHANVQIIEGDGCGGHPAGAPFDAILVPAAADRVPEALQRQLKVGGRLVMPAGGTAFQQLLKITRTGEESFAREALGEVRFVPLVRR